MAVTRKLLKGMGLSEEQIDTIIEAHTDTVDGLKNTIAQLRQGDDQAPAKPPAAAKESDGQAAKDDGYRQRYEDEHKAFEDFKRAQAAKETHAAKEQACRALLGEIGVSAKHLDKVLRLCEVDKLALDDKGAVKDADKLKETLKSEWADFITTTTTEGADMADPPANRGSGTMTKDDIMNIKDAGERQAAIAEHPDLFGI